MEVQQPSYSFVVQTTPLSPLEAEAAEGELQRLLESLEFRDAERMSRFLRHVVTFSLRGDESMLKESSIAIAVFDRDPGYNPRTDPVVRSEARRLRERMERFYARESESSQMKIDVPKGGYTAVFRQRVNEPAAALPLPALEPVPVEPTRRNIHRKIMILAGLAGTLGLGLVYFSPAFRMAKPEAQSGRIYRLTSLPGLALEPAVSPDGKEVAFAWNGGTGRADLYAMPAAGGEPRRLTSTSEREAMPAYSPDGKEIAFLRCSAAGTEVWKMAASGLIQTKVTEIRSFEWFNCFDPILSPSYPGPAWTPDGRALILSDVAGSQQGAALWELDLQTKARKQLSRPEGLAHDFYPAVSFDGEWVAFARQFSASSSDIMVLNRRSGRENRVTHDSSDIRGLTWMPDSRNLAFVSSRSGAYQVWKAAIDGGPPTVVAVAGDRLGGPAVSRDGRLLVYSNASVNINLWRQRLGQQSEAEAVVQSSGTNLYPSYSPDGKQIAWASDRVGGWEIWTAKADGADQRQLTHLASRSNGRRLGTPRWSPDGKWIVFDARVKENCAIYVIAAAGGEPRLVDQNRFEERNPSFSTDGKELYFCSNRGGKVQIWRRPADGGPAEIVSNRVAYDAFEAADRQQVYFVPGNAERGIWATPARSIQEGILSLTSGHWVRRHWSLVGGHLYYAAHGADPVKVFRFDLKSSQLEQSAELKWDIDSDTGSFAVSPDEKWFILARPELKSDLMAITLR